MKSTILLASVTVFAGISYFGKLLPKPVLASSSEVCEDGPVPVVWPLGSTGFEPRSLLTSHGQYLQFGSGTPYVHEGIDIAACIGDEVYAVEDGTVVGYYDDGGMGYGEVVIRDADDPKRGWYYVHLKEIAVNTTVEKRHVLRGQFLGLVADFPESTGFDHLHLERLEVEDASDDLGDAGTTPRSSDDPLNWLTPRADSSPPRRLPFGAPHPVSAGYLFFEVGADTPLTPNELAGKDVEIVARVSEMFPGALPTTCTPIAAACAGTDGPMEITPRRMSFGIFHELDDPSGASLLRSHLERVYHNVIDLSLPVKDIEFPDWATSTTEARQVLANYVFREDSKGDYVERHFLIRLTSCQRKGPGSFKFESSGKYVLQVVLEDASGNTDMFERRIDVP